MQEGALGIPAFSLVSFPGARRRTDLAVIIQIGVKATLPRPVVIMFTKGGPLG